MTFLSRLPGLVDAWVPIWLQAIIVFVLIVVAGIVLQGVAMRIVSRRAGKWPAFPRQVLARVAGVTRFAIILFAVALALPVVPLSAAFHRTAHSLFVALFVVLLGWIAIVAANIVIDRYLLGLRVDTPDNLMARKAATQMRILRRAVDAMLGLLTAGLALMSFDSVRQFGISLFASAGMAGIVAGLAARPLLENLFAGLQLAFTQPLRLEDAVVIDNEWGWVEEITSTYVVIRLWDWRRQIVPLSYLFQNPFTNWTRSSSSLIGSVYIYADYTLPMGPVRAKATEIVKASALWDGQVVNVQVSDAKQQVIEVRVLASATDSPRAWDLRCEIREKLIAYIQEAYPASLPRVRRQDFRMAEEPRPDLPASQQRV